MLLATSAVDGIRFVVAPCYIRNHKSEQASSLILGARTMWPALRFHRLCQFQSVASEDYAAPCVRKKNATMPEYESDAGMTPLATELDRLLGGSNVHAAIVDD